MKYNQPYGNADPNASYTDGNPGAGIAGSPVPGHAVEYTQREIVNAITAAGLTPDNSDLTQLTQAIVGLIASHTTPFDIDALATGAGLDDADYMSFSDQSAAAADKKVLLSVLRAYLDQYEVGQIVYFATNIAPTGFLKANGALLSRTTHDRLFARIGTTFGAGDGVNTFAIPDARGEFIRGWDDGRGIDSGRAFGMVQADDFKSHTHTQRGGGASSGGNEFWRQSSTAAMSDASATAATGGTETRPRNIALLACIKY